jgi:hypothetical protein
MGYARKKVENAKMELFAPQGVRIILFFIPLIVSRLRI